MQRRLDELDGLRALAAALVMLFHYFQYFPEHVPYSDRLLGWATYGRLGVDLFFVLSGFVIALTLEASRSPLDFARSRAVRLVPAMAVCAPLTFAVMWSVESSFTAAFRPPVESFLPSLTFTHPRLWDWAFPGISYVDGSYWSLFAEVRFYAWAGLIAFALGRDGFARNFLLFTVAAVALGWLAGRQGPIAVHVVETLLLSQFAHLFCAGVLLLRLYRGDRSALVLGGLAFCVAVVLARAPDAIEAAAGLAAIGAVALLTVRPALLRPFAHPWMVWAGLVSYPFYLLHQNVGLALLSLAGEGWPDAAYLGLAAAVAALVLVLSWAVHALVERPAQRWWRGHSVRRPHAAPRIA